MLHRRSGGNNSKHSGVTNIDDTTSSSHSMKTNTIAGSDRRHKFGPAVTGRPAATRQLHVPASIRCPPVLNPFGREEDESLCLEIPRSLSSSNNKRITPSWSSSEASVFDWLDSQENNSAGESSSRKVASKDMSRREVENWYHMYFRFRMESYQSLVYALRQTAKDESVFSEDHLDKWTLKMKFRIRRSSPLMTALLACASRLGFENDPDVIFCVDGFYGDALTGRLNSKSEVASRVVQPTSTSRAMGLCNGSCLFVSRATKIERDNAATQIQLDLMRAQYSGSEDDLEREEIEARSTFRLRSDSLDSAL